jgi:hypothetical protein
MPEWVVLNVKHNVKHQDLFAIVFVSKQTESLYIIASEVEYTIVSNAFTNFFGLTSCAASDLVSGLCKVMEFEVNCM